MDLKKRVEEYKMEGAEYEQSDTSKSESEEEEEESDNHSEEEFNKRIWMQY